MVLGDHGEIEVTTASKAYQAAVMQRKEQQGHQPDLCLLCSQTALVPY